MKTADKRPPTPPAPRRDACSTPPAPPLTPSQRNAESTPFPRDAQSTPPAPPMTPLTLSLPDAQSTLTSRDALGSGGGAIGEHVACLVAFLLLDVAWEFMSDAAAK